MLRSPSKRISQKSTSSPSKRKAKARGLRNLGNTCYFNAVMQCLLQVEQLKLVLLESTEITDDLVLTSALRTFFKEMYNSEKLFCSYSPQELFQALCQLPECIHYTASEQQDARELLGFLLDGINTEMDGGIPELLFQGCLESIIKCLGCGNVSTSEETFWTLPVDLVSKINSQSNTPTSEEGISNKSYNLKDLLSSFAQIESLTGENLYECNKCNAKVVATKQFKISSSPNTLIVQIKRFFHNDMSGKLDNFVKFEKELCLNNVTISRTIPSHYYIRAIVVHRGNSVSSGHYVAYARTRTKPWVEFDDTKCTFVDWNFVRRQQAYLLFYDQVVPIE